MIKGLCVTLVVIAVFVLFWGFRQLDVQDGRMHIPLVAEENEKRPEPLASIDSKRRLAPSSPVPATQNGVTVREIAGDSPVKENEQDRPHIGIAAYRNSVPEGGALLTGGWAMPNGNRMFILVSPKLRTELGPDIVEMSGEFFGVSPDLLTGPGYEEFLTGNEMGMYLNGATYDTDQLQEFRTRYESEIKESLSSTCIMARFGESAIIQIGGETDARVLSVIATQNETSGEIELAVTAAEHE